MPSSLLLDLQAVLIAVALVTPRTLVCLAMTPGLGLNVLTGMTRNSMAMAISLPAVLPTFYAVRTSYPDPLIMGALIFKEVMFGLMLGVIMSIPGWVVQSVGSIIDSQRAAVPTQANNSAVDRDASAIGGMLIQALVMVMVQAGLFVALIRIIIESYGAWPAHMLMPPFEPGHFEVVVKRFGELYWHIVVYGAPVVIPLLLIEFCFAIIGVFAPNLQVTMASSPVKSLAGLFILLVYWPTLSHYIAGDFTRLLDLTANLLDATPK